MILILEISQNSAAYKIKDPNRYFRDLFSTKLIFLKLEKQKLLFFPLEST